MGYYKEKMEQIENHQKVNEANKKTLEQLRPILDYLDIALDQAEQEKMAQTWGVYSILDDLPCLFFDTDFTGISEERLMDIYFNPIRQVFGSREEIFLIPPIERSISGASLKYIMEIKDYEGHRRGEFIAYIHNSPDCELIEEEVTTKRYKLRCKEEG